MKNAILALAATLALTVTAQAKEVRSSDVSLNASRITERHVLVNDPNRALLIQVQQEFLQGSTDLSNTSRIVLSIAILGEEYEKTASFDLTNSVSLKSVRRVSGGIYEITYTDADSLNIGGKLEVTKRIDARNAVNAVLNANCAAWEPCQVNASVSLN